MIPDWRARSQAQKSQWMLKGSRLEERRDEMKVKGGLKTKSELLRGLKVLLMEKDCGHMCQDLPTKMS